MASVHFTRHAVHFGLGVDGNIFQKMISIAVLARIIRRVDIHDVAANTFHQLVGILLKNLIALIVFFLCLRQTQHQRLGQIATAAESIVMADSIGNAIDGIQ